MFLGLVACDSGSDSTDTGQDQNNFTVNLVSSVTQINVDEEFTVTVNASEAMTGLVISYDNFTTIASNLYTNFGTTKTLKFNFDTLGNKTIYIKAFNAANQSAVKSVTVNVNRGNAVKIIGMQVVSFNNINGTWDPEYPTTNPNHLADVFFGFNKSTLNSPFESGYNYRKWYTSSVKQNQGDLTWIFAVENLYIQPEKIIRMGVVDEDTPPLGQNLLNSIQDYKDFSLSAYTTTKPTTITYSYPEINLEFVLQVEWP